MCTEGGGAVMSIARECSCLNVYFLWLNVNNIKQLNENCVHRIS